VLQRLVDSDEEGSNGVSEAEAGKQNVAFTETGMHLFMRSLKKISKFFEKSKNAGNCLKSAQNQKRLKILKKI
jgi:hypothetical protein